MRPPGQRPPRSPGRLGPAASSGAGFTLLEVLVVGAVLLITALVGFTALQNFVDRARIQGIAQSTATQLQLARLEAIKLGVPVVMRPDFEADEILLFVNVDQDLALQFQPDPAKEHRTADYELARLSLPTEYDVNFWGAEDKFPEGKNAVVGFTSLGAGPNGAVLMPDGSVRDPGAVRFADARGNFLEVRIDTRASGTALIRKFHPDPPWGGKAAYFPAGRHDASGEPMWEWY